MTSTAVLPLHAIGAPLPADPGAATVRSGFVELPAEAPYVGRARRFARCLLRRWGTGADLADSAVMVVSELAGNAVRHGAGHLIVAITSEAAVVTVMVTSRAPQRTGEADLGDPCERGRGLGIVAALADHLTVESTDAGWSVRATLTEGSAAGHGAASDP
ncbi:hypothetical protein KNE206_31570 [Kitasatospora sp. NE20-6]|uniref:ATP-binding protein n=1 Tax=Kitasatospora sp. NE20-6 TaxID=2859066 RepID=UPI0034DC24CC